jgi:23S rRNA pseudouridine1911/1915/1917 synthase
MRFTVLPDHAGQRLDHYLASRIPDASRSQIQRWIRDGRVRVSAGHVKPGLPLKAGVDIDVTVPSPEALSLTPEALPLAIVHDDADLVVVNKPAGLVVHPAAGHRSGTLVNALLHHVGGLSGIGGTERPGIVHRLDRGTSGLMVVAKHDRAHRELARQFHDREVEKRYVALVWGRVRPGVRLDQPIGRDRRHRQKMSSRASHARPALTEIIGADTFRGLSLINVRLGTGRTHQIRVHLSESGHPVVGDALYGGVRKRLPTTLSPLAALDHPFLHAAHLAFSHPTTGARLIFDAPLPEPLEALLRTIRPAPED